MAQPTVLPHVLYRVWLTVRRLLYRLLRAHGMRFWRSVRAFLYRQTQKLQGSTTDHYTHRGGEWDHPPGFEDGVVNDGYAAGPTSGTHPGIGTPEQGRGVYASAYGMHEPSGHSPGGLSIPADPAPAPAHDDADAAEGDISIQVLPPEGTLWTTHMPPSNMLRDIFRQTISVGRPSGGDTSSSGSHGSIFISPTLDIRLVPTAENWFFGGRSYLTGIATHIYPLIPSQLKHEGNRPASNPTWGSPEEQSDFSNFSPGDLPDGWVQYIHPEGRPTFYNEEKRVITESWIFDYDIHECIMSSSAQFDHFARMRGFEFPLDCHLVLDVSEKTGANDRYICGYYFISHATHSICWLEKVDVSSLFVRAERMVSEARVKTQMEYQYWFHWASFPDVNEVTLPILDVMANHVRDAHTDLLTSPDHTALPFSLEEVNNWASCVRDAREQLRHGQEHPTGQFVGRFMSFLCKNRYLNFYGEPSGQLSRAQSTYSMPTRPRSYLIKILSPMLLSAPETHLSAMHTVWVEGSALEGVSSRFFTTLVEEWKGHTVYASILLNANVAFLAIPANDSGEEFQRFHRSPTQIASYLSIINSSASMLLALLLVRQTNIRGVSAFLEKINHPTRGLEALAILYSLPYVLLVWGLVTFFAAFFAMCFQYSDLVTRLVAGPVCFLAALAVVWCIWIGWEKNQDRWWWSQPLSRVRTGFLWAWGQLWWKATTSLSSVQSLPVRREPNLGPLGR